MIQLGGKDKKIVQETQFNKYVKAGGGWVAAEVISTSTARQRRPKRTARSKPG
jgi:hypothetical protein